MERREGNWRREMLFQELKQRESLRGHKPRRAKTPL
jgi:hypothetical protein